MFTSPRFRPVNITGRNLPANEIKTCGCFENTVRNSHHLPLGMQTYWGIPFDCGDKFVYVNEGSLKLDFEPVKARYLVFIHASETPAASPDESGIYKSFRGTPQLMEPICDYVIRYEDGSEIVVPIRTRLEINDMNIYWGQGAFLSMSHSRGKSFPTATEDIYAGRKPEYSWGNSQFRVSVEGDGEPLEQWLYAFENPNPDKTIENIEIVKRNGNVFLFGVTASDVTEHPLRYGRRRKVVLPLKGDPRNTFDLIDIDLGHIISVTPKVEYPDASWEESSADSQPVHAEGKYVVEFNAHGEAILYAGEYRTPLPVGDIENSPDISIASAEIPVTLKVCDRDGKPVPVKVHAHGKAGEYLPPRNRHRLPNPYWFEDYSVDLVRDRHWSTYINGVAQYLLPLGEVFFEITKGFEIKPVRQRFSIESDTREITITLERAVDWRSKGWVTADTHVHFLSPQTALLEGEAEGVNVVNLLASQWGELFTNIGDFTGSGETYSGGEYLVRVGTENRQHIMGHISLLGYEGAMILPLTTGGPDESAQGDPMEMTLTQWAEQCRAQKGLNILPHFPNPRAESAAAIVSELIDGVEVTPNWYAPSGINPYYLSDWYRYLNCGYHVAAVGGTDKMSAGTAVGEMRTYAKLYGPLTYQTWKEAVAAGRTFATSGALADMRVEGHDLGGTLNLKSGANLNIEWGVASVTIPVTSVELVMNGDTADGVRFDGLTGEKSGYFTVNIRESAWFALRIRGRMNGQPEVITAHTSAVFVIVDGKPIFNGPDAATILDQIEGATAYVKTLATKAQESQFKLALSALAGAHRALHNRMHAEGHFHNHSPEDKHPGH